MSVHSPDVGLILYLVVLAQSALPDKRPCQVRNRVPMPKVRLWPVPACQASTAKSFTNLAEFSAGVVVNRTPLARVSVAVFPSQ
jgi:hypothetical protein